ncbi:MAG: sulfatase-like hydrolase/transferase [Myxococcales bacterium]|nr:sulfatase-like hydrolase/transferase [Myxococcales bacterium]
MRRRLFYLLAPLLIGCRGGAEASNDRPQTTPEASLSNAPARAAPENSAPPAMPDAGPDAAEERPDAATSPALNVVLILIDSLRADMPWAGYRRKIAPRLTEIEKRSVSYTRAYSLSSVTARSVAPLLVGKYASEMPRNGYFFTQWYSDNLFLGERLQAAGHRAVAAHAHAYFFGNGMKQGFSDYSVLPGTIYNSPEPKPTSERLTAAAKRVLAKNADPSGARRLFAYFHYMDPHHDYIEHDDAPVFGEEPRDMYDQEVWSTDRSVGELVSWIQKQAWGAQTAIIISADHGECFGEHGQIRHGYELWEALVHVPLMFLVPGTTPHRLDVPRSHLDLAPTILELMGVAIEPPLRGKSLRPELFGTLGEARPIVIDLPRDNLQDRRRAIVDGDLKLISRGDDERWLMYDVVRDPKERKNLTETRPDDFRRMRKLYDQLSRSIPNEEVHGNAVLKNAPPDRRW